MLSTTTALADAYSYPFKTTDGTTLTISADQNLNALCLPSDRSEGGVEVNFTFSTDKTPIEGIAIGSDYTPLGGNTVSYMHRFDSTRQEDSRIVVTLEGGAAYAIPLNIYPAQLIAKEITVKTDPTGIILSGFGYTQRYGAQLNVEVYKDAAMTTRLAAYETDMSKTSVAIHKSGCSWYKPNTKYYLKIYGADRYLDTAGGVHYYAGKAITKTVQTSYAVNPVVKSVKISNIKVTNLSTIFERKYRTTYKMTITLSKKAANIKGIKVFAAGGYYTAKGKGKTFTITVSNTTDRSYKGMKTNYRLCTFSAVDSVGGAYSSWTKSKNYTVK
ncbi:MAG: hypothetical protein PUD82_07460 [Coriobacteriaceae bacterium]|nr:hypothetical protein [Coriobacteriaceae bacterium]